MSGHITVNRKMGCTIDELLHWLPAATNQKKSHVIKDLKMVRVNFPEDGFALQAMTGSPRKIALLEIPVLDVIFSFDPKWSKLEIDLFMKRFDLYTQRGGG